MMRALRLSTLRSSRKGYSLRIVSISDDYLARYGESDREFMQKHSPCIVVLRLNFRGKERDFAVPFRSNIGPNVPKS